MRQKYKDFILHLTPRCVVIDVILFLLRFYSLQEGGQDTFFFLIATSSIALILWDSFVLICHDLYFSGLFEY